MASSTSTLTRIMTVVVTILVPVVLVLLAVRIVLNPWFLDFEYQTPGFPADAYGMSDEERLHYGNVELNYLLNSAGISYLGDLHFPDGQQVPQPSCSQMTDCTKLYNERELVHMEQVKNIVQGALRVLYAGIAVLLLAGVWSWQAGWLEDYLRALRQGGLLTLVLIGLILIFVLIGFGLVFVAFHEIFFPPGTWTFFTSDTLIRITPERFWRDTFLMVGGITGLLGIVVYLVANWVKHRLFL
jgi:integral membrane protein (TIGR01906 family)